MNEYIGVLDQDVFRPVKAHSQRRRHHLVDQDRVGDMIASGSVHFITLTIDFQAATYVANAPSTK